MALRFDVLEPETAEPLPVFDYDRAHRRVADGPAQLPPVAVQTGPDFLDDLIGAAIMLSGPLGQPAGLAVEVAALVRGGDPCVQNAPRTALGRNDDVIPAVGELLDVKAGGQFAPPVQTGGGGLVEAVETAPGGQADALAANVYTPFLYTIF